MTDRDWARVTSTTLHRNLSGGWVWDNDSDGIVPDGVRACNLYGMQRTDAAQDVKKDEEVATENHLLVKKCL